MFGFGNMRTDNAPHFSNPRSSFSCHRFSQISDLTNISFPPAPTNFTEISPVEASIYVQSLPNLAAGEALLWLVLELLGHRGTTETLTALGFPLADFPFCLRLTGQSSVDKPRSGSKFGLCLLRAL